MGDRQGSESLFPFLSKPPQLDLQHCLCVELPLKCPLVSHLCFSLVLEFTCILSWTSRSQRVSSGHRDWLHRIRKPVFRDCLSAGNSWLSQ